MLGRDSRTLLLWPPRLLLMTLGHIFPKMV
jgi:hypothetical protein